MTPSVANLDWLYHLLGWLLAAAGLLLLLWALFWDRSRGRRRCPKCWYDMAGVPGLKCPECGREARRESRFHKTHRKKWFAALAAITGMCGYILTRVPQVQQLGWPSQVPSFALVWIAPAKPPALPPLRGLAPIAPPTIGDQLTSESWNRLRFGRLTQWQTRAFLHRLLHPVRDRTANALVQDALSPHLAIDGDRVVLIIQDRQAAPTWNAIDFGIAFSYEVRVNDTIAATGAGCSLWSAGLPTPPSDPYEPNVTWQMREVEQTLRNAKSATITIRGDRIAAAHNYAVWPNNRRAACWAGSFTIPLILKEHPRTITRPRK